MNNHTATITIPKAKAKEYNELMDRDSLDLAAIGFPKDSCIERFTATFDNGTTADLKVCTSRDDLWCEVVFNDADGCELYATEPAYDVLGPVEFDDGEDAYKVDVLEG